jgi:hypothetical protein
MHMSSIEPGAGRLDVRAVILTADKFEDLELFVPYLRLLAAGAGVEVAAPTSDDISGEHGYEMSPTMLIDDVDPASFDLPSTTTGASCHSPPAVWTSSGTPSCQYDVSRRP